MEKLYNYSFRVWYCNVVHLFAVSCHNRLNSGYTYSHYSDDTYQLQLRIAQGRNIDVLLILLDTIRLPKPK